MHHQFARVKFSEISFKLKFLLAISFMFASAFLCLAQTEQGAITGVVADQSGAAVPNAKVSAVNTNTQVVAVPKANGAGNYKIPYLPPGPYTITAERLVSVRRGLPTSLFPWA